MTEMDKARLGLRSESHRGTATRKFIGDPDSSAILRIFYWKLARSFVHGRLRWLEAETNEPMPRPSPICCFILRGKVPNSIAAEGAK